MSNDPGVSAENRVFGWKRGAELIAATAAWFWFILAGCGGLGLIITTGPWPPTHGWFAMFSGLAGWPVTAWASKNYLRLRLSGRVRLGVAALIMLAGRLAVDFLWPRSAQPMNHPDWIAIVSGIILLTAVLTGALAASKKPS
ncbi:MAG: hypothetical protein WBE21_10575 [Candidatus Acidiferrales bacterium]|jgi:hypothetical protein